MDLRKLVEASEMGGEGGVAVEEARVDLAGGVAKTGDEVAPGDRSKISRVCGVDGLRYKGVGLRRRYPWPSVCRSFSWTISASTLRSDSSSLRR